MQHIHAKVQVHSKSKAVAQPLQNYRATRARRSSNVALICRASSGFGLLELEERPAASGGAGRNVVHAPAHFEVLVQSKLKDWLAAYQLLHRRLWSAQESATLAEHARLYQDVIRRAETELREIDKSFADFMLRIPGS